MKNLTEIQAAIHMLSQDDVRQLENWLKRHLEVRWDEQIKKDAAAGKLDALIAKAEFDIDAGNVRSLAKVIADNG